jgi:hypothetical protein
MNSGFLDLGDSCLYCLNGWGFRNGLFAQIMSRIPKGFSNFTRFLQEPPLYPSKHTMVTFMTSFDFVRRFENEP